MKSTTSTLLIGLAVFVGIPAYAFIQSDGFQRITDPAGYWRSEIDRARGSIQWSAQNAVAREDARSETEIVRGMLSEHRSSLHEACESYRQAASELEAITGESGPQPPSSCG